MSKDGTYYAVLDTALRRAAARGVAVRIIVSNWDKDPAIQPYTKSLAALPGITIRYSNVPAWSGGFIPFARVEHAKYLVVDGAGCWLGTSNWGRSYFHASRNVSLFVQGAAFGKALQRYFARSWTGDHTEVVDPGADYTPPRVGE